jgi:hypothetical protein
LGMLGGSEELLDDDDCDGCSTKTSAACWVAAAASPDRAAVARPAMSLILQAAGTLFRREGDGRATAASDSRGWGDGAGRSMVVGV